MPPPQAYTLTPAQLLLQAERKAAKLAKKAADSGEVIQGIDTSKTKILRRSWVDLPAQHGEERGKKRVKIVTWNMLAQTLVRRELFPGSDCLRWSDRKPMLLAELAQHSEVDIICLQECDRLKDLLPALPSHSFVRASGPNKLHGLVILYRNDRYVVKASRAVHLDEEILDKEKGKRGGSRQTKNVGLIVGLQEVDGERGVVVATTHLFWHPKFIYERVRQSLLLVRAIRQFQHEHHLLSWPAILAGDLNTQPAEATYQLLTDPSRPLSQSLIDEIKASRLVHTSVEKIGLVPSPAATTSLEVETAPAHSEPPSTSGSGTTTPLPAVTPAQTDDKDDDEEELPDKDERSIANTRSPTSDDGIFTPDQLVELARTTLPGSGVRSAFGSTGWKSLGEGAETYGVRGGLDSLEGAGGSDEPAYTCYTPLFKLTLDYVFLLPPLDSATSAFISILEPPKRALLGDGLPRKGVSASDHLPVGCEIAW